MGIRQSELTSRSRTSAPLQLDLLYILTRGYVFRLQGGAAKYKHYILDMAHGCYIRESTETVANHMRRTSVCAIRMCVRGYILIICILLSVGITTQWRDVPNSVLHRSIISEAAAVITDELRVVNRYAKAASNVTDVSGQSTMSARRLGPPALL